MTQSHQSKEEPRTNPETLSNSQGETKWAIKPWREMKESWVHTVKGLETIWEDYVLYDPNSDNLEKTGGDNKNINGKQGLGRGRDE